MFTSPVGFDPNRKPRVPGGLENSLRERENYFDPKIGEDEDGFTLRDAESLGWNVDLFHASKPFPGRGLVEVRAGSDVLDSNEGRYGVLLAIYEYELGQHRRAQARARETYLRLVRAERQQLQALEAAKGGESYKKAIKHAREALRISADLDDFSLLELPDEYMNELREERAPNLTPHIAERTLPSQEQERREIELKPSRLVPDEPGRSGGDDRVVGRPTLWPCHFVLDNQCLDRPCDPFCGSVPSRCMLRPRLLQAVKLSQPVIVLIQPGLAPWLPRGEAGNRAEIVEVSSPSGRTNRTSLSTDRAYGQPAMADRTSRAAPAPRFPPSEPSAAAGRRTSTLHLAHLIVERGYV